MRLRNIPGAREVIQESPYVVGEPEKIRGAWESLFPQRQPLHLEVGMGKGRFLMDMARLHPEINYVGMEMYSSVLLRAVQKMDQLTKEGHPLSNLVMVRLDARLLPEIFAPGEVERIYLNFSDPWPKNRYANRRLTSRQFLERYEKILAPAGQVEFKTDNRDLFAFSLQEISERGWILFASTEDLHHDPLMGKGNVMTEYEEKFSSKGNPICKLVCGPNPQKPQI